MLLTNPFRHFLFASAICLFALSSRLTFGQVNDGFTDGDFTYDPPWTGEVSEFNINTVKQLQSTNTVSGSSYLVTGNSLSSLHDMEWKFYIRQSFSPSSTNYGKVYLASDQQNLEGSLNGYYLKFGEAGSNDAVELFKQSGTTSASIARGTNGQIAASFTVTVKVTRDRTGLWNVYVDPSAGNNFALEASGTDTAYGSGSWFGVVCVYTASNASKFYFDDFFAGPHSVDNAPPSVSSISVVSKNQVDVDFDEAVEPVSAQTLSNYFVNNGIGYPSSAARDVSDWSLIHLAFATSFPDSLENTLAITQVRDMSGNSIIQLNETFVYYPPVVAAYKDIIINEVFADPAPRIGLPPVEFTELYNRSSKTFDLNGWKFGDPSGTAVLNTYTLYPYSFLVLCNAPDLSLFPGNSMGLISFPSLNNSNDRLYLHDNNNVLVDSLDYSSAWYQDEDKKNGGWSLELINPNARDGCPLSGNWRASLNNTGGTPGVKNSVYSLQEDTVNPLFVSATATDSLHVQVCFGETIDSVLLTNKNNYLINGLNNILSVVHSRFFSCADLTLAESLLSGSSYTISLNNLGDCSGNPVSPSGREFTYYVPGMQDIIINEVLADPSPQVGLPAAEFIELYNRSAIPLELNGWKLEKGEISVVLSGYIFPGNYLILCDRADTMLFSRLGNVEGLNNFPALNNSGDRLYIRDAHNNTIDSLHYSDSWYGDTEKKNGGWSLERVNPYIDTNCPVSDNWGSSVSISGGTPGTQNSIHSLSGDTAVLFFSVDITDTLHIRLCFSETIDAFSLQDTNNYFVAGNVVISIVADSSLYCANLTLAESLRSKHTYSISVVNLGDCSGNMVSSQVKEFTYYVPEQFDVVINEIMADPDPPGGLPNHEYIELFNTTSFEINLKGWIWTVGDVSGTLPGVSVLPDSFLALTSAAAVADFGDSIHVSGLNSFPSLTNTGQRLILKNPGGGVISSVSYTDQWYGDVYKQEGGWSLEQIDAGNPCGGQTNWKASAGASGGSPGRKNTVAAANPDELNPHLSRVSIIDSVTIQLHFSEAMDSAALMNVSIYRISHEIGAPAFALPVGPDYESVILKLNSSLMRKQYYTLTVDGFVTDCKGNGLVSSPVIFAIPEEIASLDVVINEVLFDPKENGVDFVELYNRSEKVIDVKALSLSSFDTITGIPGSAYTVSDNSYLLFPGAYLLLTTDALAVQTQYHTANPKGFLQMEALPAMNISDGTVAVSAGAAVIDRFVYTQEMHFALLNETKGVSLERVDFNRPSHEKTNWHSAAESAGFATPTYQNSQYSAASGGEAVKVSPEIFSPDNDGVNDVVNIRYAMDAPGFVATVTVFDSRGRVVKALVRNELLGSDGVFSWDGLNDNREKALVGIYVIYFSIFNLQGEVRHFKNICVLASRL